uniref:Bactericidal permeability-increasing protein/lipopolysaccharide-binding protein n=1 Tax=Anadara broughtonii TaxID=148819 RepID=T1PQT0_ANABR|nr:bactericidal permeability-increasing protein/lipopolysaccharide-binding protein [Anadara broughtonii]
MVAYFCFLMVLIVGILSETSSTNPGLKARITQTGLNYATKIAIDNLSSKVVGLEIPDQHGRSGDVSYDVTNSRITGFQRPQSSITMNPPSGLRWTASGTVISLKGDWHYKYKKWIIKISDHGGFDVTVRGLSFNLGIKLGADTDGRPAISSGGCSCDIGSVDVKIHGKLKIIYNLFKGVIGDKIKNCLRDKMCGLIGDAINKGAENALKKLKVQTRIAKQFMLDYRLTTNPKFTPQYMETFHKGEVLWASSMKDAPFALPILPNITEEDKMYYLSASDYILNRLAYQAQKHGYLSYNVTSQNLPDSVSGVLNTSCTTGICVGMLLHQIGQRYPDRQVELRMHTAQTPEVHIRNGSIGITGSGLADVYVKTEDSEDLIFSLNASLDTSVSISIRNGTVYGKMKNLDIGISIVDSAIGGIDGQFLQHAVNGVIKLFVEPQLNAAGRRGYEIPIIMNLRVANTKMTLMENTLIVGTDIEFLHDDEI